MDYNNNMNKIAQIDFTELETGNFKSGTLSTILTGQGGKLGIVSYLFFFAGSAMLIFLFFGGYQLMTSGGDPKKVQTAKQNIINAIMGIIIMIFAYWIVQIVGFFFGFSNFSF